MIFKNAKKIEGIEGADPRRLNAAIKKVAEEANKIDTGAEDAAGSSSGMWTGVALPRGYSDVTDQIDVLGLEMLNQDSDKGTARALIATGKPNGKIFSVVTFIYDPKLTVEFRPRQRLRRE